MRQSRSSGSRGSAAAVLAALLLLLLLLVPRAGWTAEDPARLGPLASAVLVGEDQVWRGSYGDGRYRLENRASPSDIRYYYTDLEGRERGRRRAEVAVEVEADEGGWAGLLYAFKPDPRFYYVYALTGDGKAVVMRRDESGLGRLMTIDNEVTRGRRARLGIAERGGEIELLLDGQSVGGIGGRGMGEGGIGIVAAGRGAFSFQAFALGSEPAAAPAPQPPVAQEPPPAAPEPQPPVAAPAPSPPPAPRAADDPQLRARANMGPLVLQPGRDGAWSYGFEEHGWVMRNAGNPSGLVRFWLNEPARGPRRAAVSLAVETDPRTEGAGLLFGRTEAREYFLLLSPGQIVAARFAEGRVEALQRWPGPTDLARQHRLQLAETATGVRVAVDGVELGELAGAELVGGQIGIVAFGTGAFAFRDFELAQAGPPAPPPPSPQPPAGPQPGPWGGPPPPQPGPWGGPPPQPGPWGGPPPPQPGPWGGPPPQPGPWGGPPPPQPGPWGGPPPPQPGPWGGPPPPQPGPWGGPPPPQPGPWGGPPPQPGPWGGPPPPQPGPWGGPPPPQPGPWGGPPPPQPGPWGAPPQPGPWQQPAPGPWQHGGPPAPAPVPPVVQGDATGEAGIEAIVQLFKQLSESVAQGQTRVSAPPRGWKRHTDRAVPTVSVAAPEGWQVFSVARNSTGLAVDFAQVRVSSPDGLHLVEGFASMTNTLVDADALLDEKIGELAARLGAPLVLREEDWTVQQSFLSTDWRIRAVRAGNQIVVVVAAAQNMGGYGVNVGRAGLRTIVGPAPQFTAFVSELYVPILNSMTGW